MTRVLLIDDDDFERVVVTRILANKFKYGYTLDYAKTLPHAVKFMIRNEYDYVLLDDCLSKDVNAKISVNILRVHLKNAPLIIISNNLLDAHLMDKNILQVSDIVHKNDLPEYVYNVA